MTTIDPDTCQDPASCATSFAASTSKLAPVTRTSSALSDRAGDLVSLS